ncbi:MAG: metallophosphoesterase family protein [Thermodesulfovibrionales bacterium]|jgi:predicted phosphodiesterase
MKKILTSLTFVLAFAVCSHGAYAGILKNPYLIYPGNNTTMQVLWQDTAIEANNQLCWGTDTTYGTCVTVPENNTTDNQHIFTITNLTPNTKYYYEVVDATNGVYGTGSFLTAPAATATSVKFLGFGDTRTNPTAYDVVLAEMNKVIANDAGYQGLTVHAGDWVSTDGESYWTAEWFAPSLTDAITFRANSPINGVKGNHENTNGYSTYYPKYYPFPYQSLTAKSGSTGVDLPYSNYWWSFDYGPVHFTIIDQYSNDPVTGKLSYSVPSSAQTQWIINDLTAASANPNTPWKIVMYHEPAWTGGDHTDNVTTQQYLDPLIRQYGVDLVLAGHSHNYVRTGVWNSAQQNGDSIVMNVPYITSGGGGAPLGGVNLTNKSSWTHVIVADNDFNYSTFNVNGKTLTMQSFQVNNASTSQIQPTTSSLIETLVLNQFTDVTSQSSVASTAFVYSRATKLYTGNLTITNNGPAALTGTIDVVLNGILALQNGSVAGVTNLNPSTADPNSKNNGNSATTTIAANNGLITNVTLVNATGQNNGAPMIQVSTSGLAAGASITVPLQFTNPSNVPITFTPAVLQE